MQKGKLISLVLFSLSAGVFIGIGGLLLVQRYRGKSSALVSFLEEENDSFVEAKDDSTGKSGLFGLSSKKSGSNIATKNNFQNDFGAGTSNTKFDANSGKFESNDKNIGMNKSGGTNSFYTNNATNGPFGSAAATNFGSAKNKNSNFNIGATKNKANARNGSFSNKNTFLTRNKSKNEETSGNSYINNGVSF